MTVPRVKICGITGLEAAVGVADAGADYLGVVFAERARRVTPESAAAIVGAVSGRVRGVGVFVDASADDLAAHHGVVGFEVAQLHGSESPDLCEHVRSRGPEVWKAIRPRTRDEMLAGLRRYADAVDAILIEGFSSDAAGGTGSAFPHGWLDGIDREGSPDIVLAGGLNPANVGEAIRVVAPDIVDVSSGVESAPGVKSIPLVEAFIAAARGATVGEAESDEEGE